MTQEQIKNLTIPIVVAVLVIGGVFYYQKNKKIVVPEEQSNTQEENTATTPVPEPTDEELLQNKVNQANAEELKAQEAVKKAQWNNAMNNARAAFGKGEYDKSISFYNEALSYYKGDEPYSGLFVVYSAQNNVDQARIAIDVAIKLNPLFAEYWVSKLGLLDG